MSPQDLEHAISLANSGRSDEAAKVLSALIVRDPGNVTAWLWLASVVKDDLKKRQCLERVLAIDPGNETAQAALHRLEMIPDVSRIVGRSPSSGALPPDKSLARGRKSRRRDGWNLPLALGTTVFLSVLVAGLAGLVALSGLVESTAEARQSQPEPTNRAISLPPTWTPTPKPAPTKTSAPTPRPSPTQDPLCPDEPVERYAAGFRAVYAQVGAVNDAANIVGMRSVLLDRSGSATMAELYNRQYDLSLQLSPPPCLEELHYTWLEYLQATRNMWLAASDGNYEQALQFNEQSLLIIAELERLNRFK